MDLEAPKAKVVKRVFRAWVEEWEKECTNNKDAVAEVRLLEKYKGLVFYDPEDKNTYMIESKKMEWYKQSKRKGIDGCWYVVATSDDDEIESFMIEDEFCQQIANRPQDDSVEVIRREVAEEGKEED